MVRMSQRRAAARPRWGRRAPGAALAVLLAVGVVSAVLGGPARADETQQGEAVAPSAGPDPGASQPPGGVTDPAPPAGIDLPATGSSDGEGTGGAGKDGGAGPAQAGGGALPGEKPVSEEPVPGSDGTAPVDPSFVDDYGTVWRQIEAGKTRVRTLSRQLVSAQRVLAESVGDLALATRVRNRAEFEAAGAQDQLSVAVRDLYIQGTTDVDVLMSVLGSKPDDVLRTIDSMVYMRSATGDEASVFAQAQDSAVAAQSAAAATDIRAQEARTAADGAAATLAKAKKKLAADQAELARLVSVAQPQTVVGPNGCPTSVLAGTVPDGVSIKKLCEAAVRNASTPQAAFAIKWALVRLGAPYACEGIGRLAAWRYDCSSYVSRAYAEGAGLGTAGDGWAPSTRNMVPWDGASLDPHYAVIPPSEIRPGDLVLYDTCPAGQTCSYRHVVMYLGPQEKGGVPMMAHTNACGSVAHVEAFTGTDVANFLGVRRVVPLSGEKVKADAGALKRPDEAKKPKPAGSGD